jgi:hypothetical protein
MAERDSRGMIRTSLHVPYRPKALNLALPAGALQLAEEGDRAALPVVTSPALPNPRGNFGRCGIRERS